MLVNINETRYFSFVSLTEITRPLGRGFAFTTIHHKFLAGFSHVGLSRWLNLHDVAACKVMLKPIIVNQFSVIHAYSTRENKHVFGTTTNRQMNVLDCLMTKYPEFGSVY